MQRAGSGRVLAALILSALAGSVQAEDVAVVGLFGSKAVLVIDGGDPRTLAVGQSAGRVKLLEVARDGVTVEIAGRRAHVALGEPVSVGATQPSARQLTLVADARGHFQTAGTINGAAVNFLVDTGATTVAMDTVTARRAGIDLTRGEAGVASTAGGAVATVRVRVSRITIGDLSVPDVEVLVLQTPMPQALLGMNFLNRMQMRREGSTMVLTQRY